MASLGQCNKLQTQNWHIITLRNLIWLKAGHYIYIQQTQSNIFIDSLTFSSGFGLHRLLKWKQSGSSAAKWFATLTTWPHDV